MVGKVRLFDHPIDSASLDGKLLSLSPIKRDHEDAKELV